MLVGRADGLFQWASTACRAIKDGEGGVPPSEILTRFYNLTSGLDKLYIDVLRQSFDPNNAMVMFRFQSVMGRILVTKEPLPISAHLALCCGSDDGELMKLGTPSMGSLLNRVHRSDIPIHA